MYIRDTAKCRELGVLALHHIILHATLYEYSTFMNSPCEIYNILRAAVYAWRFAHLDSHAIEVVVILHLPNPP